MPCDTCIRRNNHTQCHYASNADRQDKRFDGKPLADRLKNIESLNATAAQKTQKPHPTSFMHTNKDIAQKLGISGSDNIHLSRSEAVASGGYIASSGLVGQVDSSHWSSMLNNIRAIRDELPAASPHTLTLSSVTLNDDGAASDANFDMASPDGVTFEHILSALPPRQVCDTLVSLFFLSHYTMMRKPA